MCDDLIGACDEVGGWEPFDDEPQEIRINTMSTCIKKWKRI